MSGAVAVRRATPADAAVLAPLFDAYRGFYDQPGDLPLAERFVRERLEREESVVFLAQDAAGAALGFAQLYPSFSSVAARPIWVLNDLFVADAARGRGLGHALLEACRRHGALTGAARLELQTLVGNRLAQRLYESLGWVCQNEGTRFYTLDLG